MIVFIYILLIGEYSGDCLYIYIICMCVNHIYIYSWVHILLQGIGDRSMANTTYDWQCCPL